MDAIVPKNAEEAPTREAAENIRVVNNFLWMGATLLKM